MPGIMMGTTSCCYETPCGWCTKWDKKCDRKTPINRPTHDPTLEAIKHGEGLPSIKPLDPDHLPSGLRKEIRGV